MTEQVIGTDRALVKVKVVARGALARVQTYDPVTFTNGDVIFTSDSANATLEAEYVVSRAPGTPMEDLFASFFYFVTDDPGALGWVCPPLTQIPFDDLHFLGFAGNADGQCTNGSDTNLSVVQTGLIGTAFQNGFRGGLADAFPAEFADFHPVDCR